MIANAASFVLPISNPANLVVFHGSAMPSLKRWLLSICIPSTLSIAATYAVMRLYFRRALQAPTSGKSKAEPLKSEGKLVLAGLVLTVFVLLTASSLKRNLGLPACMAALLVAAMVSIKVRSNPLKLAKEISWATLILVAGLFVMVDAIESVGALQVTQSWLKCAEHLGLSQSALVIGLVCALGNNVVNNLPLSLLAGGTLRTTHVGGLLAQAVLIGVDLGPNLSVTGSLATILWLLAIKKEKLYVSSWDFLKLGAICMPVALLVSLGGAILIDCLKKMQ